VKSPRSQRKSGENLRHQFPSRSGLPLLWLRRTVAYAPRTRGPVGLTDDPESAS
jgi:hypothetical protein